MAKKSDFRQEGGLKYAKFGTPVQFVLNNLSEDMVEELNNAPLDLELMFQMRNTALREGFTITIKWTETFKAWQCSLVCSGIGCKNQGLAVSGSSTLDGTDAEFVALYKLFQVAQGDLTQIAPSGKKWKRG
jgi:hypothetical protein